MLRNYRQVCFAPGGLCDTVKLSHLKHSLADRRDCLWLWIRAQAKKCSTVLTGAVAHRSNSFIILSHLRPTTYRARQKIYIFPLAQYTGFLGNKFTHSLYAAALQAWKPRFYYVSERISDFLHTGNPSGYTTVWMSCWDSALPLVKNEWLNL